METAINSVPQIRDHPESLELDHDQFDLLYRPASRTFQVAEIDGEYLKPCVGDRIEFPNWKSLASFCLDIAKHFNEPCLAEMVGTLLPDDLQDFKTWVIIGKYKTLPREMREQVEESRQLLCDKYMPINWDEGQAIEHSEIASSSLQIQSTGNSFAIVNTHHLPIVLSAPQVISLVTHVLSDLRTLENIPEWYAPFLNSDQVKDLFASLPEVLAEPAELSLSSENAPSALKFAQGWVPHQEWLADARRHLKLEISLTLKTNESES